MTTASQETENLEFIVFEFEILIIHPVNTLTLEWPLQRQARFFFFLSFLSQLSSRSYKFGSCMSVLSFLQDSQSRSTDSAQNCSTEQMSF